MAQKVVQHQEKGEGLSWSGGGILFGGSRPLTAQKGVQQLENETPDPFFDRFGPLEPQKGSSMVQQPEKSQWSKAPLLDGCWAVKKESRKLLPN